MAVTAKGAVTKNEKQICVITLHSFELLTLRPGSLLDGYRRLGKKKYFLHLYFYPKYEDNIIL
jgi:hypothetical protein